MVARTRKNKSRNYRKRGGMFGFGEGTTSTGPKKTFLQSLGLAPEEPTTAQYMGLQKAPTSLTGATSPTLLGDMGMKGGQMPGRRISSRAGGSNHMAYRGGQPLVAKGGSHHMKRKTRKHTRRHSKKY